MLFKFPGHKIYLNMQILYRYLSEEYSWIIVH